MIRFTKMHGIGNDFVMVDATRQRLDESSLPDLSSKICDRRFGVGSDGLILALKDDVAPFRMRMLNPDGSESEMCGNGVRCFAVFVRQLGLTEESCIDVATGAGRLRVELLKEGIRVDMGHARLTRGEIGMAGPSTDRFLDQPVTAGDKTFFATAVSMGNPHLVIFADAVDEVDLDELGPKLERHPLFPERVNVHFVQVQGPSELIQRTWERGAGKTLACGTGACACAVAAALTSRANRDVTVHLPGGDLRIEYKETGRVFMTGPAVTVFEGEWPGSL